MIKRLIFLLVFLQLAAITMQAQPAMDTIRDCLKQKPHLFFSFDTRDSFIENSRAKVYGVKAGLKYKNRLYFGIGYNQMAPGATNFETYNYYTNRNGRRDVATARLQLFYISINAEYVFYQTKHWNVSMPLQMGIGDSYYKYEQEGVKVKTDEHPYLVYEPAVAVEYKLLKYVGAGVEIGGRFILSGNNALNEKLTSPMIAVKLMLYYTEIYNALFQKKKVD